ncbi:oxidative stress-induced growth inhibitor 1-like [Athalia rosae]|uniref:oxidative stress-induced growth inhibitor 1-like n=1 Tax=Athalia rosae TaxID=37344 RepID=UPI002033CBA8|nr:oxidative stress-induced growth inhibitor 1-like [Athalia rosae]XP_048507000.1 oxidative stress-induced growth inhibitor 1-like [Athalia rosae]
MLEHSHHEQESGESDIYYKDVVIIGNGPSGICLSYMLAGNWPYYTGEPHPGDEMLTARLASESGSGLASNTRWGLEWLSLGLEGRNGGKPLSILMDHLQHPCTDAGLDLPPLLTWHPPGTNGESANHKVFDHVVLGKGPPGGSWQAMDPNVLTISLSRWMSLPGLDFRSWELMVEAEQREAHDQTLAAMGASNLVTNYSYLTHEKVSSSKGLGRVLVGTVAKYFRDYVRRQKLEKYFWCGTTVTSVRPAHNENDGDNAQNATEYGWLVEGVENDTGKRFQYRCKRVVLATGATDYSNRLGLPGEDSSYKWLTHDLNDLETKLDAIATQHRREGGPVDPVLIVGAGLSAADAVTAARFKGIPVLHVFRRNYNNGINNTEDWPNNNGKGTNSGSDRLRWLPPSMYPEYHKVYEMMADGGTNYPLYQALANYNLVDLHPHSDFSNNEKKFVTLCAPNGELESFAVSVVAILIGSRPDLSFLDNGGLGLGTDPTRPTDGRSNPILVDDFTYEVKHAPAKGLYALGPLAGDNFVRFIPGGAFGVLTHILNTLSNTIQRAKKK